MGILRAVRVLLSRVGYAARCVSYQRTQDSDFPADALRDTQALTKRVITEMIETNYVSTREDLARLARRR
jgi:hypothetical protein